MEIVERLTPGAGVAISCMQGSPVESRHVYVKVSSQPEIEYRPNGVLDPEPFAFEIKPGSIELLDVRALAISSVAADHGSGYKWKILLDVTIDGKSEKIVVDDKGKPFVTYGEPEGTQRYQWRNDRWKNVLDR